MVQDLPRIFIGHSIAVEWPQIYSGKKRGEHCSSHELVIGNKDISYDQVHLIFIRSKEDNMK